MSSKGSDSAEPGQRCLRGLVHTDNTKYLDQMLLARACIMEIWAICIHAHAVFGVARAVKGYSITAALIKLYTPQILHQDMIITIITC